ncbi:MAG: ABC transporter permease, partial [Acutalibacteraceae bacterium]|nr:ABC transporter permease [Acutalibacteraceae bacterium]
MKIASKVYTGLVLFFLYAPIIVMIVFSFNSTSSTSVFAGFSLQWYKSLFEDEATLTALKNTLI